MKEFKASTDFVSKVMGKIDSYERTKKAGLYFLKELTDYGAIRCMLTAGGVLSALYNIFMLFIWVFIPAASL